MVTYVILGFNRKVDLSISTVIDKVYFLAPEDVVYKNDTDDIIEVVTDKNVLDFYLEKDFENTNETLVFVDCTQKNKTCYDVMYFLNTTRFDKRSYYVHDNKNNLNLEDYPPKEHFNPWTGEEIPLNKLSEIEIKHIKEMFVTIGLIVGSYLNSGFHENEIKSVPLGWMLNFATPELQHIILYYGLKPKAVDINHNVEFLHNSQFRQIVTKTLVHIFVNHLIRNKYIQISQSENWYEFLKKFEF